MTEVFYAHTNEADSENWQLLIDHLRGVAEKAAEFSKIGEISKLAYLAGWLHDLGKYSTAYQNRLLHQAKKVDHATAGAQEINKLWKNSSNDILATLIAYCVSGHHTGLPDYGSISDLLSEPTLFARLSRPIENYDAYKGEVDLRILEGATYPKLIPTTKTGLFTFSFLTRMVYSMVVDADFQDTETFIRGCPKLRGGFSDIAALNTTLAKHMERFSGISQSMVADLRKGVLVSAKTHAGDDQGFFSLTVPTGGGKTLSSLNFALLHAQRHNLDRIIYVVPYTTIIEQNAAVIKDALGEVNVLEHHSNFDWKTLSPDKGFDNLSDDADSSLQARLKLATENWDIPIVVTTNVQFFESLFTYRSSKSRKLHNIANSVVIFDEAQNLPMEFLKPSLLAVTELVWNYGVSAVFCTATQPELARFFPSGVKVQEIIPAPEELYEKSRRINVINLGKQSDQDIVDRIQQHRLALCIVNTRKHALGLYSMLNPSDSFHLSTLMYPNHRKRVITEIRSRLKEHSPCKVISTQLLEAGVDLDFPVGFRALAGLDSIIQAGGRVNRNGGEQLAPLYIFEPDSVFIKRNPGFVQQSSDVTRMVLREWEGKDPISTDAIRYYYSQLYDLQSKNAFDNKQIIDYFEKQGVKDLEFDFRKASDAFSIIGDETISVIIAIEPEAIELLDQLKWTKYPQSIARKLQAYSVNIYRNEYNILSKGGNIDIIQDRFPVLVNPQSSYDKDTGLKVQEPAWGDAIFYDS